MFIIGGIVSQSMAIVTSVKALKFPSPCVVREMGLLGYSTIVPYSIRNR
jgi:hypothetical protein